MSGDHLLTRRSVLRGTAGASALGLINRPGLAIAQNATPQASPVATPQATPVSGMPLWQAAWQNGIVYGTSLATWQAEDAEYLPVVEQEAAILFTEDDLLWWRLKPTPDSQLDFTFGDTFMEIAEQHGSLVLGAHLVWDEGFGEGWTDDDLWGLEEQAARTLIFDTVEQVVSRYRGRVAGWIVVNETIDAHEGEGLRTDVPWYQTIGPSYVAESFETAAAADSEALLILNEFGLETDDEFDAAADKREKTLLVLDNLLDAGVPVHALGVEAHLEAEDFAAKFDPESYQAFLAEVASRDLQILVTELDVLDDGLPADIAERDQAIADVYHRYVDAVLGEPAVGTLITFGLTDRYTWLQEDYPREDGEARRPLPFDDALQPKPAYSALHGELSQAGSRTPMWSPPKASGLVAPGRVHETWALPRLRSASGLGGSPSRR
jgi:endo-1,4-beta-xylanase